LWGILAVTPESCAAARTRVGRRRAFNRSASTRVATRSPHRDRRRAEPKTLSTNIGHATITLDRYGHLMPGSEVEARSMLDAYLDEST